MSYASVKAIRTRNDGIYCQRRFIPLGSGLLPRIGGQIGVLAGRRDMV